MVQINYNVSKAGSSIFQNWFVLKVSKSYDTNESVYENRLQKKVFLNNGHAFLGFYYGAINMQLRQV